MARFCISCGAALKEGARFCGECGTPVADLPPQVAVEAREVRTEPVISPEPIMAEPAPDQAESAAEISEHSGPNWLLIGGIGIILLLLLAYYMIFIRDDVSALPAPAPVENEVVKEVVGTSYFAAADANIRDMATTVGSNILGKLLRGNSATGSVVTGDDGATQWLELADGKGFIALSNLTETEPPQLAKILGDKPWTSDQALDIYAQPSTSGPILDRAAAGTNFTLYGLTANDFIEIKLKKGGVGYLAEGARILALGNVKGKPIAISFNPASCNFGGELEVEFGKLAAKSRAAYDAIDKQDYPTDEARNQALAKVEGKSYFQRLERSFNGLSITGIAQHYESQSVYFADPPEKVIAAFKAAGHKIGRDGAFPATEIYAGIGATAGEGRSYGKSDLSCGV